MKPAIPLSIAMLLFLFACQQGEIMPDFNIVKQDSTIFNTKRIHYGKPVVIVNFEADCLQCQQLTDSLLKEMKKMENIRFIFLTIEEFRKVRIFWQHFNLSQYGNIRVGKDLESAAYKHYQVRTTPTIALYNSQKRLESIYHGKPNISDLLADIKQLK